MSERDSIDTIIERARTVIAAGPPLRLAVLFGSGAVGRLRPESDIDVAILPSDPGLPLATELDLQSALEHALGRTVDLVRVDRASTLLLWEVARDGIPIVTDPACEYADPATAKLPIEALISKAYADERRRLIDPKRAMTDVGPGAPKLEAGDTTYLTVADEDGMMVSLIQSNYRGMGSGLVPDGLGFMLQDRGELFSLEAGHPNVYAPGKRSA